MGRGGCFFFDNVQIKADFLIVLASLSYLAPLTRAGDPAQLLLIRHHTAHLVRVIDASIIDSLYLIHAYKTKPWFITATKFLTDA